MPKLVITSHVEQGDYRGAVLVSILGHGVLFLFFLVGVELFPQRAPLIIGSGLGGGQGGDFVTVGLAAEPGGGAGMHKPSLVPRPAAVPAPPQREPAEQVPKATQEEGVFERKAPRRPAKGSRAEGDSASRSGAIPRDPDPGSGGPGGKSSGSGGGFGGGQGVRIGAGTGEGTIDSWYARRVEQRIGRNWLQTSLGGLARSVRTVVSFEIRSGGRIENIQLERVSGVRSVDLAAQRAVMASDPLPPLPYQFRHRTVRFIAYFEYPPK